MKVSSLIKKLEKFKDWDVEDIWVFDSSDNTSKNECQQTIFLDLSNKVSVKQIKSSFSPPNRKMEHID